MSYNQNDAVLLKHLLSLGSRVKTVTDGLDTRIETIENAGYQANVLEGVKVNGVALAIAEKMVDILIATGTANGTIKVNGTDISIAGLAALAYKAEVSAEDLSSALAAVINGKAEASDLTTLSGKVTTLIGSTTGDDAKSARAIAAEEVAKIVANADEDFDTLKEIADWIASDSTGAAKMANDITALQNKLTLGTHAVTSYAQATGTYVSGTTYYTDSTGSTEVDSSGFTDGVTDVSSYYVAVTTTPQFPTVKAYVESVVSGFISLTALSVSASGTGNVVTDLSYNSATGEFTKTLGTMVAPVVPSAANNLALLSAAGQLVDAGAGFATDAEVSEALDTVFGA